MTDEELEAKMRAQIDQWKKARRSPVSADDVLLVEVEKEEDLREPPDEYGLRERKHRLRWWFAAIQLDGFRRPLFDTRDERQAKRWADELIAAGIPVKPRARR